MANSETGNRVASSRPTSRRGITKSQIREERRQRSQARKKRRRILYMTGGSLLAAVFILSLTIGPGLVNNQSGEGGNLNFEGPVTINQDAGAQHVNPGTFPSSSNYNETPATSGPHWIGPDVWELPNGRMVDAPADWGKYDYPLPDQILIHNLEHGGIGFHYDTALCGDTCDELVAQFEDIAPNTQFIISPYAGLEKKIAITSWRHHLYLDEFDAAQIDEFIDEYIDRAPESIPGNLFN